MFVAISAFDELSACLWCLLSAPWLIQSLALIVAINHLQMSFSWCEANKVSQQWSVCAIAKEGSAVHKV